MLIGRNTLIFCYNQVLEMVYFYFEQKFDIDRALISIDEMEFQTDGTFAITLEGDMDVYDHDGRKSSDKPIPPFPELILDKDAFKEVEEEF